MVPDSTPCSCKEASCDSLSARKTMLKRSCAPCFGQGNEDPISKIWLDTYRGAGAECSITQVPRLKLNIEPQREHNDNSLSRLSP